MRFENIDQFDNLKMSYVSNISGGYISKNNNIFKNIELTDLTKFILNKSMNNSYSTILSDL